MKVTGILAAAGIGKRLGASKPKQFIEIAGRPILEWSIRALTSCPTINAIVVAAPPDNISHAEEIISSCNPTIPIKVIAGGPTRQESVRLALEATDNNVEWVAIHDAARPMVQANDIEAVCLMAMEIGAAILAIPIHDTVKEVDEDTPLIVRTLNRDQLFRAQTPQVCRKQDLITAMINAKESGMESTDEAGMLEAIGISVGIVNGSRLNFKITTEEDLLLAKAILETY